MRPVRHDCRLTISGERRGSALPNGRRADPGGSQGANGRAGTTLVEVLMSILIMAVGVVSVFTLFPISVLRTIQATQQTNSKIHKLNTSELVKTSPGLLTLFEPGVAPFNFQGEQWRPNTVYNAGTIVVPTIRPGQAFPAPLIWYTVFQNTDIDGDGFFESGADEPDWLPQSSILDGELRWDPILDGGIPLSYVVDPLGFRIASDDATSPSDRFGNKTDAATGVGVAPPGGSLLRIHGGLASTPLATANVALGDSWEEVASATPASATDTSVTFPPTTSLTDAAGAIRRMVLTSTNGQMTIYRAISNIVGQQVNLAPAEPIPARFPRVGVNPEIGTARIEYLTRRYTFFLTVRNNSQGQPDIKCVVVFNRDFSSASEHVYDANFGGDIDVDADGNTDDAQHGLGIGGAWVKIAWPNTEPEPLLKPGNWVFDARDVTWYRVQEVFDEGTAAGMNFAVLILDRNVRRQSFGPSAGQAMLMPGIVEVFNL